MGAIESLFPDLSFRHAVLLFPVATALHVLEEWRRFPRWARRFASPDYTDHEYVIIHALALAVSFASAALLWFFPTQWLVFLFFAFIFGPGIFCNAFFHAAASIRSQTYCPGVLTGLLVYLPLSLLLATLAVRDNLASAFSLTAALSVAAVFHTVEVGRNVYKSW